MRALILAGGKGTRLRPLTDTRPKPLVPFMGAPFAAGLLCRLRDAGCREATFLVGASAEPFAPLRPLGERLGIAVEVGTEDTPLDTAGAVRKVLAADGRGPDGEGGPVLVCNGDILTDLDYRALVEAHERGGWLATIALARVQDPSTFGVVTIDRAARVTAFVEKPAPGTAPADTVNAGTYVLGPSAFDGFDADGPLSFEREVFPRLLGTQAGLGGVAADCYWSDLGTPERYRAGHAAVLRGHCRWPVADDMRARGDGSAVHRRAETAASAVIEGDTVVGDGAVVADRARLRDAVVLDNARVGEGAVVEASVLAEGVSLGPGARAVGDTVIGDSARIEAGVVLPEGARIPSSAHVTAGPSSADGAAKPKPQAP